MSLTTIVHFSPQQHQLPSFPFIPTTVFFPSTPLTPSNCFQTTSAVGNYNSLDQAAVTDGMLSSLDDQGKASLVYSSLASQGIQSSMASPGLNPMSLPSLTNLGCTATNVGSPSYHLDNVSGVSHNSVGYGPRHYTPYIVSSSQSNVSQQQLVSQLQMQPAHLQQHMDQMNPIALQRDVHQWPNTTIKCCIMKAR
ncbi:hypothetical protein Sjap_025708 [Stephania japonica]|uniref:Uncharacterized protein n=1 Tax=Stephania japonica TaxID=461633 RepID=A0AAP0E5P1_9MAGN